MLSSLFRNLFAGLRLALFLPVSRAAFRAGPMEYAALATFNVLVWLAASSLRAGPDAEFDATAAVALLSYLPIALLFCLLAARALRDLSLFAALAVMFAATDFVFEVAGTAIFFYIERQWLLPPPSVSLGTYGLYLAWAVAVVLRMQLLVAPWGAAGAKWAALLLAGLVLTMAYVPHSEPWVDPAVEEEEQDDGPQDGVLQVRGSTWLPAQAVTPSG